MTATKQLIGTVTVGSGGAAGISFASIPQTYTDLCIIVSVRTNRTYANAIDGLGIDFNASGTGYSERTLYTPSVGSDSGTYTPYGIVSSDAATAGVFSVVTFYISNYTASTSKNISIESVAENNSSSYYGISMQAGLWANNAAITSLYMGPIFGGTLLNQYTTASLYGITKGSGGATVS